MDENQKWLHEQLKSKGLYTKDYEDFVSDYSTPKAQAWLHEQLSGKKLVTSTLSDFQSTYFSQKKNRVGNASGGGSSASGLLYLS